MYSKQQAKPKIANAIIETASPAKRKYSKNPFFFGFVGSGDCVGLTVSFCLRFTFWLAFFRTALLFKN
jgi:hypothetical protein